MPQYQILIENDNYDRLALIAAYVKLTYVQRINGMGYATLEIAANDPKIPDLVLGRRLKIIRDGVIVYGGRLLHEGWKKPPTAPSGETWAVTALDHAHYAKGRIIVPAASSEYDTRTDHADDVAKAYVYYHLGQGAAAARRSADVTVAVDKHQAASITENGRYDQLLTMLENLHNEGGFDWRFVPQATGCEFRTAYPRWGYDRTKGNGSNDECVFSDDRHNWEEMEYARDATEHANYLYVAGQGEGADRTVRERSTAADIATWGRCEAFADARQLSLAASLDAYGDGQLRARKPNETMNVVPRTGTWKILWDLGDLVTVYDRAWGRTFEYDAKIMAVTITITPSNLEQAKPTLEAEP